MGFYVKNVTVGSIELVEVAYRLAVLLQYILPDLPVPAAESTRLSFQTVSFPSVRRNPGEMFLSTNTNDTTDMDTSQPEIPAADHQLIEMDTTDAAAPAARNNSSSERDHRQFL